jgi:molecular chaperone DnaK
MRQEAEANAEADKQEKEKVEKINSADSLIFQTEKHLKEYGDKLSEGNKKPIEDALAELREAHGKQDLAAIDAAMEKLNNAWQGASQEMYQAAGAQQGAEGTEGAGAAGDQQQPGGSSAEGDDVSDVEYEEVDDKDKK